MENVRKEEMMDKNKKNNKYIKTLAATANVLNTLGGGISEPYISYYEESDCQKIGIKVPGVNAETLKVEINNNKLIILHIMEVATSQNTVAVPRVILNQAIPYYIQIDNITASFEEGRLIIRLPFNERAKGYHRSVEIRQQ